jgi:hypothetical protein
MQRIAVAADLGEQLDVMRVTVRDSSAVWPIAGGSPGQQEFMVMSFRW